MKTEAWKDLAYLIRFWHQTQLFLSQYTWAQWLGEEGLERIAGNQARMGLPFQEVQREVQGAEGKGQTGQARPRTGLSKPPRLQAPGEVSLGGSWSSQVAVPGLASEGGL